MSTVKKIIRGNFLFQTAVNVLLFMLLIILIYPLYYVVICSFSDANEVAAGNVLLFPRGFNLQGYRLVLENKEIWIGYLNTVFYTVAGTIVNLAVTMTCAYGISRKDLYGRKFLMLYFMITMYVGGGLIPTYLNIQSFGLLNTRVVLLISGAMSVYNMIVARTFFTNSIPYELTEAAQIDGASDIKIFMQIVMPLSKAILVVEMLYYGIGHWNAYFNAMIYLKDREKYPLQLFLREILLLEKTAKEAIAAGELTIEQMEVLMERADSAELIKYCVIIVSTLPMLIIYPKLQKYFEKGVMIGSVKG